jgi:hypothetical protein
MDRVVMEVVESETVYVRDLQQVVEVTSALLFYFSHPFSSLQPRQRTKENFLFLLLFFTPCTTTIVIIVIIVIIIIIMRKGGWVGREFGRYGHPAGSEERDFAWRSHERTHIQTFR